MLLGSTNGVGNSFFNFGVGIFTFVFSFYLIWWSFCSGTYSKFFPAITISLFGMVAFSVGSMFWFYYDFIFGLEIPFPSMSDFFYVSQFPFTVVGLFFLTQELRCYSSVLLYHFESILKSFLFVVSVLIMVYVTVLIFVGESFGLADFFLFYFPFESFSILVLTLFITFKYTHFLEDPGYKSLMFLVFGQICWVVGDSLFFYEILTSTYYNAGLADVMYLTGAFLLILGWSHRFTDKEYFTYHSQNPAIYFQKISFFEPMSVN